MSRTKLFATNSFVSALQQMILLLYVFIVPRILITVYGSEINGLVVSLTQFIQYFLLVEAGISGASIYALYKPLAENNIIKRNAILSAAHKFYFKSGYIFTSLVVLLALIYPFILKQSSLSFWQVTLIVLALGVNGVMDFFTLAKYRVLLTADQRAYVISSAQIVYYIISIVIVFISAKLGFNIVLLECLLIISVFVRSFILWKYTNSHYKELNYKEKPDEESLKERWNVFYLQILGSAQNAMPIILATIYVSLKEVSVFSIYNLVIAGIGGILSVFISGLSASFGDVIARGQNKTLQKANQEFEQSYYMLITIVYSVALLLILPFVKLYTKGVSDINYIWPIFAFMITLNGFLYNLKTPQGMLVISAGLYRQTRWQTTIQALIAFLGGIIGGYFWGLYGIVGGLILSNIYRDIDLYFFIPKHVTKLHHKYTLKHLLPALIIFTCAVFVFIMCNIIINSVLSWLLWGCILTFIFITITIFLNLCFDKQNMKNIFKRIYNLLRKKI